MHCDRYAKFLYMYKEGELDAREQRNLFDHLEQCRHCRSELEQIRHLKEAMGALQSHPPKLSRPERLTNRIMRQVQGNQLTDTPLNRIGRFEQFIDWLGIPRVRLALISAAVGIILLFAFQEMMILSRLSSLERKIESTTRLTTVVSNTERLERVINKLLADIPEVTGSHLITLSRGRLLDLLGAYRLLRNENIILRSLLERRFPELARHLRGGAISEQELEALARDYEEYIDLLRQL